jgi:hypothetical protein
VVTAETCITSASTAKPEWKLGVSGDLQLRLNGLVAEVNAANLTGVRMAFFTVKPNQRGTRTASRELSAERAMPEQGIPRVLSSS